MLAKFLNATAIDNTPPRTWREAKIVPIFKQKGNITDLSNYRSIAINPPFAKIFMTVINNRLTRIAKEAELHAPTQAGFREFHGTMEQALII
jgi:hypothetical protein